MKIFLIAPHVGLKIDTIKQAKRLQKRLLKFPSYELISLLGKEGSQSNVFSSLEKDCGGKGLIIYIGHGGIRKWDGIGQTPLLEGDYNKNFDKLDLLKNKFIYSLACNSAAVLGHAAVLKGAVGFLGFNNNLAILDTTELPSSILKKEEANKEEQDFWNVLFSGINPLLSEKESAGEVRKYFYSSFCTYYNNLKKKRLELNRGLGESQESKALYLKFDNLLKRIRQNANCLVHLGDPNWKIEQ